MRKIKLDNVYESPNPPDDINVLWGDIDESTGELVSIKKYNTVNNEWEPYMESAGNTDNPDTPSEIVLYPGVKGELERATLIDTANNYKHHCVAFKNWESPLISNVDIIHSEPLKRGSTLVSIYDRDWSSSNDGKWADYNPVIGGTTYKVHKGVFGYYAGNDGFQHKFHVMNLSQYEQFKVGKTASTSSLDRFDMILILKRI